jgi:hypothetical protein
MPSCNSSSLGIAVFPLATAGPVDALSASFRDGRSGDIGRGERHSRLGLCLVGGGLTHSRWGEGNDPDMKDLAE